MGMFAADARVGISASYKAGRRRLGAPPCPCARTPTPSDPAKATVSGDIDVILVRIATDDT